MFSLSQDVFKQFLPIYESRMFEYNDESYKFFHFKRMDIKYYIKTHQQDLSNFSGFEVD
jgi:hypothetical protein